jgi:hypothetical protein
MYLLDKVEESRKKFDFSEKVELLFPRESPTGLRPVGLSYFGVNYRCTAGR